MKLSEYKQAVKIRWKIIASCAMFNFRESLVYAANNWASLLSMLTYMVTYLFFMNVLFGRVKSIAGYSYAEMLFFTLVGQISYYLTAVFSLGSIDRLDKGINTGELDLWLVKPVPALWFATFQKINLGELIFGAIPATIPLLIILSDKWSLFRIGIGGLAAGVLCLFMGQIIIHCFQFMISMTAFFTGEGKNAKNLGMELSLFGDAIPFEGYPNFLKIIGLTVVPFVVHTSLTTSFVLGKNTNYWLLVYVFGLMVLFLGGKKLLWKFALRHYSSASS